jgi:hypothetical protein
MKKLIALAVAVAFASPALAQDVKKPANPADAAKPVVTQPAKPADAAKPQPTATKPTDVKKDEKKVDVKKDEKENDGKSATPANGATPATGAKTTEKPAETKKQ